MSDWWERRRRRYWWRDIFDEFERFEEMLDEMMRRAFEQMEKGEGVRVYGPYVYGFSMSIGPDGKPIIREFGNVQPGRFGPQIREEREPLVDVMEEKDEVVVVAELPGVEKEDINLNATEDELIRFCKAKLAGYKCPKSVEFWDSLPTTAVGKILRKDVKKRFWEGLDRAIG